MMTFSINNKSWKNKNHCNVMEKTTLDTLLCRGTQTSTVKVEKRKSCVQEADCRE